MRFIASLFAALGSANASVNFGPGNCVSLTSSSKKTCVLRTNCSGKQAEIDAFEFAFTCTTPKQEIEKHSFGVGGFDEEETFDTDVKCDICAAPPGAAKLISKHDASKAPLHSAANLHSKATKTKNDEKTVTDDKAEKKEEEKTEEKKEEKPAQEKKEEPAEEAEEEEEKALPDGEWAKLVDADTRVQTGPGNCVNIYRRKESNTCVINTQCKNESLDSYEFGLDCIDPQGQLEVRHLFGQNSFLPEEWFDTLITCKQCVAMEDPSLETSNKTMEKRIKDLETEMTAVKGDLQNLSKQVKESVKESKPEFLLKQHKKEELENARNKAAAHVKALNFPKPQARPVVRRLATPRTPPRLRRTEEEADMEDSDEDE